MVSLLFSSRCHLLCLLCLLCLLLFVVICCYLLLFVVICCYLLLFIVDCLSCSLFIVLFIVTFLHHKHPRIGTKRQFNMLYYFSSLLPFFNFNLNTGGEEETIAEGTTNPQHKIIEFIPGKRFLFPFLFSLFPLYSSPPPPLFPSPLFL